MTNPTPALERLLTIALCDCRVVVSKSVITRLADRLAELLEVEQ